jgi:orotidine-5'-phosphate decarboxylase
MAARIQTKTGTTIEPPALAAPGRSAISRFMSDAFRAALARNPVFCALDTPDLARALTLGRALGAAVGGLKLGLEFFSAQGPAGVKAVAALGRPVFLDLKLHDIPNTVASAVTALGPLGAGLINVHAQGGPAMMRAAAAAARERGSGRPLVVAVTILTSLDEADLAVTGVAGAPLDQVLRLARLAQGCGLDGVVCSAAEIAALRAALGPDFLLVVPGLRPEGAAAGDQKRLATPAAARQAGADLLVVGRPITAAPDPAAAARAIAAALSL